MPFKTLFGKLLASRMNLDEHLVSSLHHWRTHDEAADKFSMLS